VVVNFHLATNNKNDMEKFTVLLLWIRLIKMRSMADYWNKSERYKNGLTSENMSQN